MELLKSSRNTGKVSNALAKVQAEMGVFRTNKEAYSFSYLDLAGIFEVVLPIMGEHNLSITQVANTAVVGDVPFVRVTGRLSCEDEWIENTIEFPLMSPRKGMTEDIMLFGSTTSYLRRYQVQMFLGIAGADKNVEQIVDEDKNTLNLK